MPSFEYDVTPKGDGFDINFGWSSGARFSTKLETDRQESCELTGITTGQAYGNGDGVQVDVLLESVPNGLPLVAGKDYILVFNSKTGRATFFPN